MLHVRHEILKRIDDTWLGLNVGTSVHNLTSHAFENVNASRSAANGNKIIPPTELHPYRVHFIIKINYPF